MATGRVSQVYLLGEIVAAFTAIGRSMATVDCSRCPRRGRLSLQRLLAEHGPLMRGPDLLTPSRPIAQSRAREARMTSAGFGFQRWLMS